MTPQFTTSCYVWVDDKDKRQEVCEKLEPIGYKIKVDYTDDINPVVVASKLGILYDASHMESPEFIDCGINIDLFLALAGMRGDTDMRQRFIDEDENIFINNTEKYNGPREVKRLTAQEIIENFKIKQK